MSAHHILFGGGAQPVTFVPDRRVEDVTFKIEDFVQRTSGSASRILLEGTASLNAADTGITQAAGPNTTDPRLLVVADIANLTGSHRYQVRNNSTGEFENFTIRAIQGTNVKTEAPLLAAYPSGSTVKGIELTALFPAASAGDNTLRQNDNNLRIVWDYTLDESLTHHQQLIRIVHHNNSDVLVDEAVEQIQLAWGDYATRFVDRKLDNDVRFAIAQIEQVLLARGIRPEEFLMGSQGQQAVFWRTMWHLAQHGHSPGNRDIEAYVLEMQHAYEGVINNLTIGNPGEETEAVTHDEDTGAPKPYHGIFDPI